MFFHNVPRAIGWRGNIPVGPAAVQTNTAAAAAVPGSGTGEPQARDGCDAARKQDPAKREGVIHCSVQGNPAGCPSTGQEVREQKSAATTQFSKYGRSWKSFKINSPKIVLAQANQERVYFVGSFSLKASCMKPVPA